MGWSGWITDPPYAAHAKMGEVVTTIRPTSEGDYSVGLPVKDYTYGLLKGLDDPFPYGFVYLDQAQAGTEMTGYSAEDFWLHFTAPDPVREPAALGALTLGVDYDVIPGRDPAVDLYAYVDYDPATPPTVVGWTNTDIHLFVAGWAEAPGGTVSVYFDPTAAYPDMPYGPDPHTGYNAYMPWHRSPTGLEIATLAYDAGANTWPDPTVIPLDIPAGTTSWTISLRDTLIESPPLGVDGDNPRHWAWLRTYPYALVDPGRYRYWKIGGAAPLRQVQRDDGLGRSVARARGGTSVQRSLRQRGYR